EAQIFHNSTPTVLDMEETARLLSQCGLDCYFDTFKENAITDDATREDLATIVPIRNFGRNSEVEKWHDLPFQSYLKIGAAAGIKSARRRRGRQWHPHRPLRQTRRR
ncbi:hypothetical protein Fcan01_24903, partial [Folsomia candida]